MLELLTVPDAERAVAKFSQTRADNAALTIENSALIEENVALIDENSALHAGLLAQREDLRQIPADGEVWRADVLYTAELSVVCGAVEYTALRWSLGKEPELYPEHWAVAAAPSYPHWDTLSGTITLGTRCLYPDGDGVSTVWECILTHVKFSTFKPSDSSEQWARAVI